MTHTRQREWSIIMKSQSFFPSLLWLALLAFQSPLNADEGSAAILDPCEWYTGPSPCEISRPCGPINYWRLYSGASFGRGLGLMHDYGTIGVRGINEIPGTPFYTLFDASYHYISSNRSGASALLGCRYVAENRRCASGLFLFYDYTEGKVADFNQVGVSAEWFVNCFEFRLNGYFPVGDKTQKGDRVIFDDYDNTGRVIPYIVHAYKQEMALSGFDGEVGVRHSCRWLASYAGVGPYYYRHSSSFDAWGVIGKLRMEITSYVTLEGQVTWDQKDHTRGRGIVTINLPLPLIGGLCDLFCGIAPSLQPVYRNDVVRYTRCCTYKENY